MGPGELTRPAADGRARMLHTWAFGDEIGDYPMLAVFLERHRRAIEGAGDSNLTTLFKHYRSIADAALAYEAVHGAGARRKLDHPWWAEVFADHEALRRMEASGITGWVEPQMTPD